jgi:hypothetical protein
MPNLLHHLPIDHAACRRPFSSPVHIQALAVAKCPNCRSPLCNNGHPPKNFKKTIIDINCFPLQNSTYLFDDFVFVVKASGWPLLTFSPLPNWEIRSRQPASFCLVAAIPCQSPPCPLPPNTGHIPLVDRFYCKIIKFIFFCNFYCTMVVHVFVLCKYGTPSQLNRQLLPSE